MSGPNFFWYWPFAWAPDLALAEGATRPGERVVVQVVDRAGAPAAQRRPDLTVTRSLPEVERDVSGAMWALSRARTYVERSRARRRERTSERFDLVHYHYVNRFTDAFRAPQRPWVLSVHDVLPHQPRLGRFEIPLHRRLYSLPDALVVHHDWLRERLEHDFDVPGDRIFTVPLQVPIVASAPLPQTMDRPLVLFFGAIRENKGIEVLAQAIESVDSDAVRFHIAGRPTPSTRALVESLAERHDNVEIELGFITDARKNELFHAASVVVMPYTAFESQSAVLADAYGHGRPVIVSDVGALGDTVRSDESGLVVAPGDAEDLAAAIAALCATDLRAVAAAARAAGERRSPQNCGAMMRAIYDEVL